MKAIRTPHLGEQLGSLGEFIAAQRRSAELSLRQLAEQAGVSNPYLSQIERGLRRPSAEVLQQLARALRVSAETLYVRAGILDPEDHPTTTVETAVLGDLLITERQKRVLIDVYTSFVNQNRAEGGVSEDATDAGGPVEPSGAPAEEPSTAEPPARPRRRPRAAADGDADPPAAPHATARSRATTDQATR